MNSIYERSTIRLYSLSARQCRSGRCVTLRNSLNDRLALESCDPFSTTRIVESAISTFSWLSEVLGRT